MRANKAAATNQQCQQCLKYGHWTYECKAAPVYKARPSRTQQLKHKRLRQGFMEEEAPPVPPNMFLGDDRQRGIDLKAELMEPALKKLRHEKVAKKEKKAKSTASSSSSSSSSSSDSDSDSSSSSSASS
mmetsp:Transcript_3218/g.4947  ORF Transcript_3218/g.4947 Transcript_3218/m.4947 type:complete len:129 (-) Transcript_3218:53-439(-)